jgi:hypothetical protein
MPSYNRSCAIANIRFTGFCVSDHNNDHFTGPPGLAPVPKCGNLGKGFHGKANKGWGGGRQPNGVGDDRHAFY